MFDFSAIQSQLNKMVSDSVVTSNELAKKVLSLQVGLGSGAIASIEGYLTQSKVDASTQEVVRNGLKQAKTFIGSYEHMMLSTIERTVKPGI